MAGIAAALQLPAVGVFAAVAARAIGGQMLAGHGGGVACVAGDLGVRAFQGEVMACAVIVVGDRPMLIVVTVTAGRAETPCMCVVRLVAAIAILGDLVLEIPGLVTRRAGDAVVYAQ